MYDCHNFRWIHQFISYTFSWYIVIVNRLKYSNTYEYIYNLWNWDCKAKQIIIPNVVFYAAAFQILLQLYYCIVYSKDQKRKIWNKVSLYNFSQKKFWNWIYRIYGSSCSFEFIHLWLNLSSFLHRYLFRALYRMA